MNATQLALNPASEAATFGRMGLQPLHAFRSLRKLIADKEDTVQVFEIIKALSGKSIYNGYQKMLSLARRCAPGLSAPRDGREDFR